MAHLFWSQGCLESLVQYGNRLIDLQQDNPDTAELRQKCKTRLETLQRVDPLRRIRYAQLSDTTVDKV